MTQKHSVEATMIENYGCEIRAFLAGGTETFTLEQLGGLRVSEWPVQIRNRVRLQLDYPSRAMMDAMSKAFHAQDALRASPDNQELSLTLNQARLALVEQAHKEMWASQELSKLL